MVAQNRYYVVPIVNVDGVALITDYWNKNNEILMKRKNMNPKYLSMCDAANGGVDLNRNYGKFWGKPGGSSTHPCDESFEGDHPFSEPETQAIRDFLTSHKDEIKFVYNFHSYGNMYLWPYNGEKPNGIGDENPGALQVYNEIWNDSHFPTGTLRGNAWEALRYSSSGEQSDWILSELGIPSICPELGSTDLFSYSFILPYRRLVFNVLR